MSNNFSSLINGFKVYLEDLKGSSDKDYTITDSDISIFKYEDEFKDYLSDELDIDPEVLSMNLDDILNMEIENGKLINPEYIIDDEGYKEQQNELLIGDFINTLLDDETIRGIVDIDQNNKLNEEEIDSFINTIKGYDGNNETISLEDIFGALKDINNGIFKISKNSTEKNKPNTTHTPSVNNSSPSSTQQTNSNYSSQGTQAKTLDKMNSSELQAELNSAKTDLANKKSIVSQILDGSYPQLKQLEQNIEEAYKLYQSELKILDEDLANQLDNIKIDIDAKEKEIDAKEQEIYNQEGVVSDAEKDYDDKVEKRKSLESSLAALEATDTSNMTAKQKAQLKARISSLRAQVQEARKAENNAKKTLEDAKDTLETLENEKEELISGEGGLNKLKEQKSKIEENIAETYPQVTEYMNAYNEAKQNYDNTKEAALSGAKADVKEAENYLEKVQTTIDNYDGRNDVKQVTSYNSTSNIRTNNTKLYSPSQPRNITNRTITQQFDEKILDLAYSFLNYSEQDMESECGISLPNGLWCAAFVQYIMEQSGEEIPEWYQNIVNKHWCPNIYQAASEAGAIVDANEAQPGDIVLFYVDDEDGSRYAHIGFVTSCENGILTTIEGNSYGDADNEERHVAQRTYDLNNNNSWVTSFTFVRV